MEKPRILIVDDEDDARHCLVSYLNRNIEGEIIDAGDGRKALEIVKENSFDLVLLDIKMPGISGIDVLRKIKTDYPDTEVIMISAYDSQSVAQEAFGQGAVDYITKPSTIKVIYEKVCDSLKKRDKFLPKKMA